MKVPLSEVVTDMGFDSYDYPSELKMQRSRSRSSARR
jgi:hypothetical protein